jgi:hypothetical protein
VTDQADKREAGKQADDGRHDRQGHR